VGAGLGVASTDSLDPSDPFISCRVKHVHALSRAWDTKGAIKLQADVPADLSKASGIMHVPHVWPAGLTVCFCAAQQGHRQVLSTAVQAVPQIYRHAGRGGESWC
jgi:hypothetical protein